MSRTTNGKAFQLSVLWLSLALVIAACGSPAAPTDGTSPGPDAPAAEPGGTLRVDIGPEQINGIDANAYTSIIEKNVTLLVAETLVYRDENFEIQPSLAEEWSVADDGVTWTFNLREGVTFHDGTPFNADAVIANFERWEDPNLRNSTLVNIVAPALASFEAVDEYTVQLVTDEPRSGVLGMLSGWGVQLVSPTALEEFGDDIGTQQVGTGPFRVDAMVAGESLRLVRNEDYWGGAPLLEAIEFRTIAEPSARTAALLGGEVDLSYAVEASQIPNLEGQDGIVLLEQSSIVEQWIEINECEPPLDNKLVRQALNYAVDMEEIKNVVYGGYLNVFQGPVPTDMFEPDPAVLEEHAFEYNPDRARELLEEAGVSDISLSLNFNPGTTFQRFGEVLQGQLAEVGIELQLNRLSEALMEEAYISGNYVLQFDGFSNSSGDPWQLLATQLVTTASNNQACHTGYDELTDQIGASLEDAERAEHMNALYEVYFDQAPYLATSTSVIVFAMRDSVQGFVGYPNLDFHGLIETSLAAES
jgi:ABC-type transport system substrate-binding protein